VTDQQAQPVAEPAPEVKPKVIKYLWTTAKVAEYFRVTDQTIRLWVNEGNIQAYRIPGEDDSKIKAHERRGPLYFTEEAVKERALVYFKLN
jgi:excisionase family DNA binding protein